MEPTTCPSCQNAHAFFIIIDHEGAHYQCHDCSYKWCDKFDEPDQSNKSNKKTDNSNDTNHRNK